MDFKTERIKVCYSVARLPKRYYEDTKLVPAEIDVQAYDKLQILKENIIDFVDCGFDLLIYSANTGNGKTT